TTSATSRRPLTFSPAATPPARNPREAVTVMCPPPCPSSTGSWRDSRHRKSGGLVQPQGDVHGLHGPAGRALGEVVDSGHDDQSDRKSTRLNSSHVKTSYTVF